jgi:hypothetical protein
LIQKQLLAGKNASHASFDPFFSADQGAVRCGTFRRAFATQENRQMDQSNERLLGDKSGAHDLADTTSVRRSNLKELLAEVGAFLTAVLAIGGGIYVLSRNAGPPHGANVPMSAKDAAVAPLASMQPLPTHGATTIYRCEVNGKTVYADAPCSRHNIRSVDVFVNKGFQPTDTSPPGARSPAGDEPAP